MGELALAQNDIAIGGKVDFKPPGLDATSLARMFSKKKV